jgi:hypothetical protein
MEWVREMVDAGREVLMIAGAGGAVRATGWRATAIRFQQFGEGGGAVASSF